MKRAFVTGGSGYVGRNLITYLCENGYTVSALARSDKAAVAVQKAGAEVVEGDLFDRVALKEALCHAEVVFHVASSTALWDSSTETYKVNVIGTETLLEAAKEMNVKRFIYVSTEAVLLRNDGMPLVRVNESCPRPTNSTGVYSRTKGLAEERVLAGNTSNFSTIVVRPRLIWGRDDTSFLSGVIEMVKAGRWMWIGGGHHLTSTTHITNACEGLLLAAERGLGGSIYFVTDGEPVDLRTFVTALLKTQNVDPGNKTIGRKLAWYTAELLEVIWNMFQLKGAPPIHRTVVQLVGNEVTVDDSKARRELGYVGKVTPAAGLAEMWQCKSNSINDTDVL